MSAADAPDAALELAEVLGELRAMRRAIEELRLYVAPELAWHLALLEALDEAFRGHRFAVIDVLEEAATPRGRRLYNAILPMIGEPVSGARRLARRFARLADKPAGNLVLRQTEKARAGYLYLVSQTPHWTAPAL